MTFFPHLSIYMDIVFGQLHLLMLGTELEAVPADTVSDLNPRSKEPAFFRVRLFN